ncbi:MAG: patatin-like phospholipase family protein, partial [Saprospiraceae bacterium]|nr:patatin-like phospholipase family protein [Saprospiraceae bacterium]
MSSVIDKKKLVQTAQNYLRGERIASAVVRDVAMTLFDLKMYSYARRVLARLYDENPYDREIQRKWAIATYKDDDQPGASRFAEAAVIISQPYLASNQNKGPVSRQSFDATIAPPQDITYSEDAAILGSVFKQKWRYDNQQVWLEQSLMYYERGYQLWKTALDLKAQGRPTDADETKMNLKDGGYSCLNVAYLCDMLAAGYFKAVDITNPHTSGEQEMQVNPANDPDNGPVLNVVGIRLQERAFKLRREIIQYCSTSEAEMLAEHDETLEKGREKRYWYYITWAEALLGLDDAQSWALAQEKVEQALQYAGANSWLRDTTTQQNAAWIDSYHFSKPGHKEAARKILERVSNSITQTNPGKRLGLALSGGGFRAALFHIGVLARLAEQDLLRNVEVISCVSGGSILGAFYYLKIRNLLQNKPDEEITREDYIQLVREIQREFLEYINYDLRTNLFLNPLDNLKMVFNPDYSRTLRLADLYEKHLYSKLLDKGDAEDKHIYMQDLLI